MKHRLFCLWLLLSAAVGLSAYDFKYGDLCYNITSDSTVEVTSQGFDDLNYVVLTSAKIPASIEYAGKNYNVTSIGAQAFCGSGLVSITIPSSVTSIGVPIVKGCSALTSITVESENSIFDSRDNCNAIIESTSNTLIVGCKNTTIPNSVTSIGNSAFSGCGGLTSITIPNSVTSIGDYAFYGCSGLTSITIPNSVTSIGLGAFSECSGLTSINIPNSVTSIGLGAFSECSGLTSINIPNSVTSIGDNAFSGCRGLTSITIPSSVTSIGWRAFSGCSGLLISITIPNSVTSIGDEAFKDIFNIVYSGTATGAPWGARSMNGYIDDYLVYSDATKRTLLTCNSTAKGTIIIPNSVTSIGDKAFYGCSGLTSVTIPNGVTSIGDNAFNGCRGLTSVTIPNSVTSIGNSAFYGCSGLTSITIPSSVTSIANNAFSGCRGLTSVTIPNSVTSIEWSAFYGCSGLTSVTIPSSVTSIANNAFNGCRGLTSITIPSSVTSIGRRAFSGCSGLLTSITIPNSVTSIGDEAFKDIFNIVYSGTATGAPWGARSMNGYIDDYLVYSDATKRTLLTCNSTAKGTIIIPNSVTSIGDKAFYGCSGLTSITIPNSVTSIGYSAFYGCSGLTSITFLGYCLPSIKNWAFDNCNIHKLVWEGYTIKLTDLIEFPFIQTLDTIVMPANGLDVSEEYWARLPKCLKNAQITSGEMTDNAFSVLNRSYKTLQTLDIQAVSNTSIADEAFKGCYNLRTLLLPSQLTKIPYMAVADCKSLQEITIPATVEEIDNSAFEDCRSIQTITFEGAGTPQGATQHAPAAGCALHRIGNWAFYNCHELQHLTIPEGVTEIGDAAFYGCTYLQDLTLPAGVEQIGDNCFALCSKLQKITVLSTIPPTIAAKTFYDVNRAIPVYVPAESVADYKGDIYWKEFNIQANATPIDHTQADETTLATPRKVVRNGQVLIIRGGKTYTATGIEVE